MIMTRTCGYVNMQCDVLVSYNINITDSEEKIKGDGSDE